MLALASFAFSPNASPTCDPDGDHGCLNGAPYDRAKQFPCGSSGGFMDAGIFDYDSTGCCGEGLTYDPAEGYCCGGKTYSYNSGKCNVPGTNVPAECYCDPEAQAKFDARVKGPPAPEHDSLIDTTSPPETGVQCNSKATCDDGADCGCMNSYQYHVDAMTPCGVYLMDKGTFGCCETKDGLLPYVQAADSCCKVGDYHEIKGGAGADACTCKKYGCG